MPSRTSAVGDLAVKQATAGLLSRLVREPLLHFVVLGTLIWAGLTLWRAHDGRYVVEVDAAQQKRLAGAYLQQFGYEPTAAQMQQLLDSYVEQEIAVREGVALHLERDDEIIRRRIIQKYEFLQSDLAMAGEPTPAQLRTWFEQHKARYQASEQLRMTHVFFSPDRDGDAGAHARASQALPGLQVGRLSRASTPGDPFPGPTDIASVTRADAARIFGASEVSDRLFSASQDRWEGPFKSGYGWHLVYVSERRAPRLPPFEEVQDQVRSDYLDEQRRLVRKREDAQVRSRYTVQLDPVQ